MPKLFKSAESHNSRIAEWKERLGTLGANPLPGDVTELLYQNHEKNYERQDKYSRITSYMKGWLLEATTYDSHARSILHDDEKGGCGIASHNLPEDWWEIAKDLGKNGGEHEDMPISPMADDNPEEKELSRGLLYDQLFPAYAAVRESFKSRPWYQWFTNHAQYTAERDSMHAMRGMIMTLTGLQKDTVDNEYNEYRAQIAEKADEIIEESKEAVADNNIKVKVDISAEEVTDKTIDLNATKEELDESIPIPEGSYISHM